MEKKTHKIIQDLNNLLRVEKIGISKNGDSGIPPVFIVGAPRSGTTLLYQLIISAFKVGYIDNLTAKFWEDPALGLALTNELLPFDERGEASFSSESGFTKGITGPHEFGYFWQRWFNSDKESDELSGKELKDIDHSGLVQEIYSCSSTVVKPIIFKNPVLITLHISYLTSLFPDAIVIFIKRAPFFNAQSLLEAREKYAGDKKNWFSAKPEEYSKLKEKNVYRQVVAQLFYCLKKIDLSISQLRQERSKRFIEIGYEDLCRNPELELDKIAAFFGDMNVKVDRKEFKALPFDIQNNIRISKKIEETLRKEIKKIFK